MHEIVILGGNFSGITVAHYLLRHVLPLLNTPSGEKPVYKITLVSPSSQTFFKIAAPRALLQSTYEEKVFASIPDAFSRYPASLFTFVQGEAVHLDEATRTISVKLSGEADAAPGATTTITYDSLVIATGTTSASPIWTLHGTHQRTADAIAAVRAQLPSASTILIAGGGAAGVETAGEVGANYGGAGKEIILLSGGPRLLPRFSHATVPQTAENKLASLGVTVVHNVRATAAAAASPGGRTIVTLSNGTTKTVDVYLDATGGVPNSSFLPAAWLDENRRVATDVATLRATKAPAGVYALGDVASYSKMTIPDAVWSAAPLGYTIWKDLSKEKATGGKRMKEKKYKQFQSDMAIVPIGPSGGVGIVFGWAIPNFLVRLAKARDYMIGKAPLVATGDS